MQDQVEVTILDEAAAPSAVVLREPRRRFSAASVHPLLRNVGLTGFTTILTAIATMIAISLVGRILGPVLLGEYLLVRRMASWLQAAVVLPSGIALPRYVAASEDQPRSTRQAYFLGAATIGCGTAILLSAIFAVWRSPVSRIVFGSAELASLAVPLGLLLLGLAAHAAVFGFFQGMLFMGRACTAQVFNMAILPVLAIVALSHDRSIGLIVSVTGLSMFACAAVFSISILRHMHVADALRQGTKRAAELVSFGLSRTWGDFGLQALLSLPAVIAAHYLSLGSVSFLLLGGSFLAIVAAANLPVGIILLSQVTRSLAQGRMSELRGQLKHFVDALVESSVFLSFQMLVFADSMIRIWVGPSFSAATRIVQALILAVPFYFVYGGLRSVVDAAALKAHNTRNILISLAVFLVAVAVATLGLPRNYLLGALALSVVVAMGVLAWLTMRTIHRLFDVKIRWSRALPGIGFAAVLGACSFALHRAFHFDHSLLALILYELFISAIYLAGLWLCGSPWLRFLAKMVFSHQLASLQTVGGAARS